MESGVSEQVNGVAVPIESTTKNDFCAGEEVDMDVDMEVEDSNSAGNTAIAYALNATEFAPSEQPINPRPPSVYASSVPEDTFTIPPPPDEEWIPPPPPDNEQVPPPHLTSHHLSPRILLFTEGPSSTFYGHPEGCQVSMPHAPLYYAAVPGTYTETSQAAANPVESVTYYGLQDGTGISVPVVNGVESLQFHSESAPLSYENLASDRTGSINSFAGAGSSGSLPNVNIDSSAVDSETGGASMEVPSTTSTIQAPATISVKSNVPVPSTNHAPSAASIPATSEVTKAQSKVPRTKKRTVAVASSLRSNKKVSSLVDKWKAAKEELLEDEEEPQNAYELFERKRQRGIEEWYAQQITSGEAKDNANFQPLGGDWREKVKRRKAQLARKAGQTASTPGPEAPMDGNQKPDLAELSRGLPSGWQAYWDESSKQVYYGNTATSETTWTKPTK
ncbi:uncharacterized protein Pyn_16906 [Prunus yedoensis var. nudiflora]|uniref:WW domain-containing protein n=1 Tax=Prunus yedoensis var. nudiflora TaxID=2094558 RepID=A0A314ZFM3_PRUYE|nr:uncharacterized protein Pyn_16906 [Prunus yedoensis var. nudiflora]